MDFLNIGTGEIFFILLLAILLVGPKRAVEFVQQGGRLVARLQKEWRSVQREVMAEVNAIQQEALGDVGKEVKALQQEMGKGVETLQQGVGKGTQTLQREMSKGVQRLQREVTGDVSPPPDPDADETP